ncbi:hypothetical protein LINPERPRIM_LOCUS500, partial [Linum perenne]
FEPTKKQKPSYEQASYSLILLPPLLIPSFSTLLCLSLSLFLSSSSSTMMKCVYQVWKGTIAVVDEGGGLVAGAEDRDCEKVLGTLRRKGNHLLPQPSSSLSLAHLSHYPTPKTMKLKSF